MTGENRSAIEEPGRRLADFIIMVAAAFAVAARDGAGVVAALVIGLSWSGVETEPHSPHCVAGVALGFGASFEIMSKGVTMRFGVA